MDQRQYRSEAQGRPGGGLTGPAGITPLAERLRPGSLGDLVGQDDLVGPGKLLDPNRPTDKLPSLIFWGPPGCGKTTLARLLANQTEAKFVSFSAVLSGVAEVRRIVAEAKEDRNFSGKGTVLFVDEIHRFNKAQQDAFLPHVESGLLTLLGATTENPSFAVIPALLSRTRVVVVKPLSGEALSGLLDRALVEVDQGLGGLELTLDDQARNLLIEAADGDGRRLLNSLETAAGLVGPGGAITKEAAAEAVGRRSLQYDRFGDSHYDLISALHKSLRGSDPDAALYWLVRMLESGADPLYLARRLVVVACEDVGNADPRALTVAMDAMEAYRFLGKPEGELALAQACTYLATAPKSNAAYVALSRARRLVKASGSPPVPYHLRNAPTKLMSELGYAKDYLYPHDQPNAWADQDYWPEGMKGEDFYQPVERGYETRIKERLNYWRSLKKDRDRG